MRQALVLLIVVLSATMAYAQGPDQEGPPRRGEGRGEGRPDGPPEGPRGFGPPQLPLIAALDADGDGNLSKEEIDNAAAALRKLDKDEDGKLSEEEIGWPPMRGFAGGFGGGPRGGGPGGPGGGPGGFGGPGGPGGGPRGFGGPGGDFMQRLMSNDRNGDGKLAKDELPEFLQERFDAIDANKDGAVDQAELEQMREQFRRNRPGGEGGRARPQRPARPESER